MSESRSCPTCGLLLRENEGIGLCSTCLAETNVGSRSIPDPRDAPPTRFEAAQPLAPNDDLPATLASLDGTLDSLVTRAEEQVGSGFAKTTEAEADPDATSDAGARIGFPSVAADHSWPSVPGYEIRGVLGRGGMGVVYKAMQTRASRMVALKMILGDVHIRPGHLDRFRIEAESVAALHHPNIVQVYEVGEIGGLPFFSLELLEGGTLAERMGGTPMRPREAAMLLATLARALHAAHQAGIVHRDLKPANILFDADGLPKVVDFGLAKRLASEDGQTMTGQVMGTPAYMAPEQARGENREVGPLADVYALGAVLYESITGRPPFKGPSAAETVRMVVFEELVPPSRLQPKLCRDLETICLKCLAKECPKRYGSAGELADDLDRYLADEPIRARPTPAWERGVKWARRRPATALSISFGMLVLIALVVASEWYAASARNSIRREERRIAAVHLEAINDLDASNREQARGEWTLARLTLSKLLTKLRSESSLTDVKARAEGSLNDVERRLAEEASRNADLGRLGQFRRSRDEALFRDTQFTAIEVAFQVAAVSMSRETRFGAAYGNATQAASREAAASAMATIESIDSSGSPMLLPVSLSADQRAEVDAGRYLVLILWSEAIARPLPGEDPKVQARKALQLLDRAATLRESTPAYHLRRASCLERAGVPEAALAERAKAAQVEPVGAFDHLLLGQELARSRDWNKACRQFEEALRKQPDLFWARCLLAVAELNCSPARIAEARVDLSTCLIQQPSYAWLYLLRGFAYGQQGAAIANRGDKFVAESEDRFEGAEADFAEALRLGLDASLQYTLLINRGTIRYLRRRFESSAADFSRAIELDDTLYLAHLSLAQALRQLGRRDEAIDQIGRAIDREPTLPAPYRERALARLDRLNLRADVADLALRDLEESARREPPGSRLAAGDHARRGRLLVRLGRPSDALAAAESALAIAADLPEAHLVRIGALLDLGRYVEVVNSCDVVMAQGSATSDLHRLRGLGRAGRGEFAGAVEDYTQALAIRPDWSEAHSDRGWSYLFADAVALALRDFETVVRLTPADPDGPAGRAAALVRMGRVREALIDVEASLKLGDPIPRTLHNAARTYAQAAMQAALDVPQRGRVALRDAKTYEQRAASLLRQALERTPPASRVRWLREVVAPDVALRDLRRSPVYAKALEAAKSTPR